MQAILDGVVPQDLAARCINSPKDGLLAGPVDDIEDLDLEPAMLAVPESSVEPPAKPAESGVSMVASVGLLARAKLTLGMNKAEPRSHSLRQV